jgi:small-conductance mechanosensitive channel
MLLKIQPQFSSMNPLDFFNSLGEWNVANLLNILFSIVVVIAGYILFRVIAREIRALKGQKRLEEHAAFTLNRILKWIIFAVAFSLVLAQFGITVGAITGLLTLLGGTIIGFAAINTLGNAIAGLIVMTSRPFKVGDRIFFNGKFADVVAIELIYTKMLTLDNVLVSIPNQELLKSEVENYGKKSLVRRSCAITAGYDVASEDVEKALLEAANKLIKSNDALKEPEPYVRITEFGNFAVEYTLYAFTKEIKRMAEIDANIMRTVLETCKEHGIDLSTPSLIRSLKDGGNTFLPS